jgi:hypothetical protein
MTVDTLLETLDHMDADSDLTAVYGHQFRQQAFRTVADLLETQYFTPAVLRDLFEPKLPFGLALRIMRCAHEEVLHIQNLYFAGDHSIIC